LKKNLSDILVAMVVVLCSLALLGALTYALSGDYFKKASRTLQIDYPSVTGINLASQLRYAGAKAGHVVAIHPLTQDERNASGHPGNAIRVTVAINDDVPALPADAQASIDATLLSEKFIALSAGTPDGKLLANGSIIEGHPGGLDLLLNGAGPLMKSADDLLASLQGDLKDVVPRLNTVLDSTHKAVEAGETLLNNANSLVDQNSSARVALEKVREAVENLKGLEKDLDDVVGKAGGLVTNANGLVTTANQNVDNRMKELSVVLQNLKVATTYLKEFSKQIGEKPNRVIFMGKPNELTPESAILKTNQPVPAAKTTSGTATGGSAH
jgi:ABC-type transporter Mla subunit MlaD